MRDVTGVAVHEEGNAAAPRTDDKPAMDTDMVLRVEPNVGCAELGLQIPKPFRVPSWKIHGPSRHELQGKNNDGDENRPGNIPGDAQHEITVAFRDVQSAHGLRLFAFRKAAPSIKEQRESGTGYAGIHG